MTSSTLFLREYPRWLRPMLNHPNRPGRNRVVRRVPRPPTRRPMSVRGLVLACNCDEVSADASSSADSRPEATASVFLHNSPSYLASPLEQHGGILLSKRKMNSIFLAHASFLYNDDCNQ